MNPEELQEIINILSKFYIWEILIIGIAILLTAILKLPIKKKAVKLQEKYGVDKSMLTWITALIPYILCAIMVFLLYWYRAGFVNKLESLDYAAIFTEAGLLGSGAIGLYEAVKKIIKGSIAIKEKKRTQLKLDNNSISTQLKPEKAKMSQFRINKEEK